MATFTTNWLLRKPATSDDVDVAADLNANWDIVDAQLGSGTSINVQLHGAVGDGVADDTTAIQAAIDAAGEGDTVWFPAGTYLVSATIVFPGRITLMGGGGIGVGTTIRAAAGITDAILASAAWYNNSTTCGTPVRIQGIEIDGNNVGTAVRGLALLNFWSRVYDVQIRRTTGHGIEMNDRTRDGVNIITNSCSEQCIIECRFSNIGGDAIHQEANRTTGDIANLDGHIVGCFIASVTGHAISLGRAAGWVVERNHLYGIGLDGVRLQNAYATIVRANYIENFGQQDVAAASYAGINFSTILGDRASICADNTVSSQQPDSPNATLYQCYFFRANTSVLRGFVTVTGNAATFALAAAPTVKRSVAFRFGLGGDTGRLLQVEWGTNLIQNADWWQNTRTVNAAVDLREVGRSGTLTLTDGATVALDAARAKVFKLVAAGNRTISVPTNPVDGQGLIIAHTASGGAWTLTLTTGSTGSFAFGADITALTATTSGTTDYIGCVYNATSARWHVLSCSKGYA